MPNERQTILLRMNNIDDQLLIFYREKGKLGCLWCGDVEKIHSRYSTISLSSLEDVFGYQERWAEYRYHPALITGRFRSTAASTLDSWHLAQRFMSRPLLNNAFIN